MNIQTITASVVGVALAAGVVLASGDSPTQQPRSPMAVGAIHKHDEAVARAKQVYQRAVIAADKAEATELQRALLAATHAGNLQEANAINAARNDVLADEKVVEQELAGTPDWVLWNIGWQGGSNKYWILKDGTAISPTNRGKWKKTGSRLVIQWHGERDIFIVDAVNRPISGRNSDALIPFRIISIGSAETGAPPPPSR